jgi:hypothetical protein
MSNAETVKMTHWGIGIVGAIALHSLTIGYWGASIRKDVDYLKEGQAELKGDVREIRDEIRDKAAWYPGSNTWKLAYEK